MGEKEEDSQLGILKHIRDGGECQVWNATSSSEGMRVFTDDAPIPCHRGVQWDILQKGSPNKTQARISMESQNPKTVDSHIQIAMDPRHCMMDWANSLSILDFMPQPLINAHNNSCPI